MPTSSDPAKRHLRRGALKLPLLSVLALALVIALPIGATTVLAADPTPPSEWLATIERDHPLVGRVWSTQRREYLPLSGLPGQIARADLMLLGEVHDNPDHHRLRGWLLRAVSALGAGTRPAAVFEHLRPSQREAIEEANARTAAGGPALSARDLLAALRWNESGWPDGRIFEPLFQAVLDARLAIVAGDAEPSAVRDMARQGLASLSDERRRQLLLDTPLGEALENDLLAELEASHCNMLPRTRFANMASAQRLRDAQLAARLVEAVEAHGSAVLLTGNGHVRRDRGVPWYLARMSRQRTVETVVLLEVVGSRREPEDYVERGPDGQPVAGFVLFTPRAERKDPCVEMREMMGRHQSGRSEPSSRAEEPARDRAAPPP